MGSAQGRNEPEDEGGENREEGRKDEGAPIDPELEAHRKVGRRHERHEQARAPVGEQHTQGAREEGEHRALGQEQAHEP